MSKPGSSRVYTPFMSILVTVILGVVIVFGTISLLQALSMILPTKTTTVDIIGIEEQQRQSMLADRIVADKDLQYRIRIQHTDGSQQTLACAKKLYDVVRRATSKKLEQVTLHRSILAERPVALSMNHTKGVETHALTMPIRGILVSLLICWGVFGWAVWKLCTATQGFSWSIFSVGSVVFIIFAFHWWRTSI